MLSVNEVFQDVDSSKVYRVLWIDDGNVIAYLIDIYHGTHASTLMAALYGNVVMRESDDDKKKKKKNLNMPYIYLPCPCLLERIVLCMCVKRERGERERERKRKEN